MCPAYNISAQTAQKTPFLYCCAVVAFMSVGILTCLSAIFQQRPLFAQPSLSNICCKVAYFTGSGPTCSNIVLELLLHIYLYGGHVIV
jgi:hypothetical protein